MWKDMEVEIAYSGSWVSNWQRTWPVLYKRARWKQLQTPNQFHRSDCEKNLLPIIAACEHPPPFLFSHTFINAPASTICWSNAGLMLVQPDQHQPSVGSTPYALYTWGKVMQHAWPAETGYWHGNWHGNWWRAWPAAPCTYSQFHIAWTTPPAVSPTATGTFSFDASCETRRYAQLVRNDYFVTWFRVLYRAPVKGKSTPNTKSYCSL